MAELKIENVAKDAKLLALVKTFMTKERASENYDFYFSKDGPDKVYAKFFSPKAAMPVDVSGPLKKDLDALAGAKKWKEMPAVLAKVKESIRNDINLGPLKKFVTTKEYLDYAGGGAPAAPKPPAAPPKPPAASAKPPAAPPKPPAPKAVDLTPLKAPVAAMEKDIADGAGFVTTAMATVKAKGKPANPIEVNRMFQSMRMRHDKVHEAFTALLQKNKDFTKANFGPFFAKKETFTKLCADYRKLLGA